MMQKVEKIKNDSDDFYGEYMCDPSRTDAAFFDRVRVDNDIATVKQPHRESAGLSTGVTINHPPVLGWVPTLLKE